MSTDTVVLTPTLDALPYPAGAPAMNELLRAVVAGDLRYVAAAFAERVKFLHAGRPGTELAIVELERLAEMLRRRADRYDDP